jgi:Zn-dependent M16 (insulinase) family peptidase
MSLSTIESSFATHTTNGIRGFEHPEYPAVRVALEVLNATESYLWVSSKLHSYLMASLLSHILKRYIRGSGLAYGAYASLDVEAGFLNFSLYRVSLSHGIYVLMLSLASVVEF